MTDVYIIVHVMHPQTAFIETLPKKQGNAPDDGIVHRHII